MDKRVPVFINVIRWENYLGLWSILLPQTLMEQPLKKFILRKYSEPKKVVMAARFHFYQH